MATANPDKRPSVLLPRVSRTRFGMLLVDEGFITPTQLHEALRFQKENPKNRDDYKHLEQILVEKKSGKRLGEILLKKFLVTEEVMRQALFTNLNIARLDIDPNLTKIINRDYAFQHNSISVSMTASSITLVMDDPTDNELVTELEMFTHLKINIVTFIEEYRRSQIKTSA